MKIARRYPAGAITQTYDTLLADGDLDAVVIATPAATHHKLASAALRAGKRVFVEEPLASFAANAIDLLETPEVNGLVLMPGHTFVYSPPVTMIKDLIDSDELGEIYFVSTSRVNLGLHQPESALRGISGRTTSRSSASGSMRRRVT